MINLFTVFDTNALLVVPACDDTVFPGSDVTVPSDDVTGDFPASDDTVTEPSSVIITVFFAESDNTVAASLLGETATLPTDHTVIHVSDDTIPVSSSDDSVISSSDNTCTFTASDDTTIVSASDEEYESDTFPELTAEKKNLNVDDDIQHEEDTVTDELIRVSKKPRLNIEKEQSVKSDETDDVSIAIDIDDEDIIEEEIIRDSKKPGLYIKRFSHVKLLKKARPRNKQGYTIVTILVVTVTGYSPILLNTCLEDTWTKQMLRRFLKFKMQL